MDGSECLSLTEGSSRRGETDRRERQAVLPFLQFFFRSFALFRSGTGNHVHGAWLLPLCFPLVSLAPHVKGDDSTPIGDWVRRLNPLRLLVAIDLDVLSKLLAYENSLTLIV